MVREELLHRQAVAVCDTLIAHHTVSLVFSLTFGSQIVASPASTPYATQTVPEHNIDAYGVGVREEVVPSIWIFLIASIGERKTSCEAIGGVDCLVVFDEGEGVSMSGAIWSARHGLVPRGASAAAVLNHLEKPRQPWTHIRTPPPHLHVIFRTSPSETDPVCPIGIPCNVFLFSCPQRLAFPR